MNSPVHDVPEKPILIVMLLLALAVMLWRLRNGDRFTLPRAASGAAACIYGVAVAREVLQPFQIGIERRYCPGWRAFLHLTPLVGAEPSDLFLNALLFFPLGALVPLLTRARSLPRVVTVGMSMSLVIETVQLMLDLTVSVGRIADINDLLGDTLGTLAGYFVLQIAIHPRPTARFAAAVSWPKPVSARDQSGVTQAACSASQARSSREF